jgi:hypothetical protein
VHETRAVHRLDHGAHRLAGDALRQAAQTVGVRRHRGLRDQLAALVDKTRQADVDSDPIQRAT